MANVKRVLNNKEIKVDMSTTVNLEMTTLTTNILELRFEK